MNEHADNPEIAPGKTATTGYPPTIEVRVCHAMYTCLRAIFAFLLCRTVRVVSCPSRTRECVCKVRVPARLRASLHLCSDRCAWVRVPARVLENFQYLLCWWCARPDWRGLLLLVHLSCLGRWGQRTVGAGLCTGGRAGVEFPLLCGACSCTGHAMRTHPAVFTDHSPQAQRELAYSRVFDFFRYSFGLKDD